MQGTIGIIQGTIGIIQGTIGIIQGTIGIILRLSSTGLAFGVSVTFQTNQPTN
jgi:hypothetical protein